MVSVILYSSSQTNKCSNDYFSQELDTTASSSLLLQIVKMAAFVFKIFWLNLKWRHIVHLHLLYLNCLIWQNKTQECKKGTIETCQTFISSLSACCRFVGTLTWRLRERRRLLSKCPRLASSLPRKSPSTALPPMVPYSTQRPSVAKQLTFCSQLHPPMQSSMMSAPLPVKLQWSYFTMSGDIL